jgi:hypothetical protein
MLISSSTLKDFGTLALFLITSDSNSLPDISIPSESNKVGSACTFGFGFLTGAEMGLIKKSILLLGQLPHLFYVELICYFLNH